MLRGKVSTYYAIILFETTEFKMAAVSIGKRSIQGWEEERACDFSRRTNSRDDQRIKFAFITKQNRSNCLYFGLTSCSCSCSCSSPFSSCSCFVYVSFYVYVVVVVLFFLSVCLIRSSYGSDLPGIFNCSLQEYHCNIRKCTTLFYKDLQEDPIAANCG